MSRVSKWKLEKTKVKVVFRLQFHATHIPQSGWDKLFISFLPADSGKTTAKTTKASVRNGACKWADPIYETTRLLQDTASKKYDDKLYKLVVAMGSSRSGILGDATINLADYADALRPATVALPLQGCSYGTMLHVTAQLLTSKTGFREFEQQRELRERVFQTGADLSTHDETGTGKTSSSEDLASDLMDKVNAKVRLRPASKELPSVEEQAVLIEEQADSSVGFDGSSNTSDSLCAEKHDTSSAHEVDSLKSTVSGEMNCLSHCPSPQTEKGHLPDHRNLAQGSGDLVHGWSSDCSLDNNLAIAYEENSRLKGSLEVAESSILELKLEVSSLKVCADELGIQTQKLVHQLAAEIASGEELAKEVSVLKSKCSKFRIDLEQIKNLKVSPQFTSSLPEQDCFCKDVELLWQKGILLLEDKIKELQSKACVVFPEKDFIFLHSDLEALLSMLHNLKQGLGGATSWPSMLPYERSNVKEISEMTLDSTEQFVSGTGLDLDLYQPQSILNNLSMVGRLPQESHSISATDAIKKRNMVELLRELDEAKVEKESIARKMDQMECYYEALVLELEENQKQMLGELQNLRSEHSCCIYTLSVNKAEMESVHQEFNEQMLRLAEERRDLDVLNKELERRAITSEAALKRARQNYSIAVDQLQKDLELLSFQVLSMHETNENLIKQAFQENSQLSLQGPVARLNLEDTGAAQLLRFHNQSMGSKKQLLGGDILLEDFQKSLCLQEVLYQKVIEELCELHSANLQLDLFSKILQETLHEANADIGMLKLKISELAMQLELSTESRNMLIERLHNALDDVQTLNEYKVSYTSKCNDMLLQNRMLESKLEGALSETCVLSKKITELEALVFLYSGYQTKYETYSVEKMELENKLKQESLENDCLQNKVSSLTEELNILRVGFDELVHSRDNLQKTIKLQEDKLGSLLASYDNHINQLSLPHKSHSQKLNFTDADRIVLQLEEIQHNAFKKILLLMKEKEDLADEKHSAEGSLSAVRSEFLAMKQKFKKDIQDMAVKLDTSNSLVVKVQLELESVANKLRVSSELEERYVQQNNDLIADLALFEVELQNVILKNREFVQEMVGLDSTAKELGRTKLIIDELVLEKQNLMKSLKNKDEELVRHASELDMLKESMKHLQGELQLERDLKDRLQGEVTDVNCKLNETHDRLLHFSQEKAELLHSRQRASDLEHEKYRVIHLLRQREECLERVQEESSAHLACLESQLSETLEHYMNADVELICVKTQYGTILGELIEQFGSSDRCLNELKKRHLAVEAMLNHCLESEVHWKEENAMLVRTLESLRSDSEDLVAKNRVFSDLSNALTAQVQDYKESLAALEVSCSKDLDQHILEVEQLKLLISSAEKEIDYLLFSKEELEITLIVLKDKLDEQHFCTTLQEEHNGELMMLRNQCSELTQKLSEQVLKTEEFKNLSIHLRELKDKADNECVQARKKRETEGPTFAMQESLRIVFIKEQYETKLQELRQQLSISKKHGEEMLWKLQDAIDEIEHRKKSEASHLKRNQELALKILELEEELQSVLSDKRDKIKAYDRIKAELECALLSLECCNEEKVKLETALRECDEEKSKLEAELTLVNAKLENSASLKNMQNKDNSMHMSRGLSVEKVSQEILMTFLPSHDKITTDISTNVSGGFSSEHFDQDCLIAKEAEESGAILIGVGETSAACTSERAQDVPRTPDNSLPSQEDLLSSNSNGMSVTGDYFGAQSLKSSIECLYEELEKMKNDNLLVPQDLSFDPDILGYQKELMQLQKVNEELGSIFPSFNEYPGGNALERVLALEIELADALRAKKKSTVHFQSSFLKQHSDEEAVLRSFRDINELIRDMLELKGRFATVETELKDMHDRYTKLSLQFAEVEGERQKLMMTLKTVRAAKKQNYSSHSWSATVGEYSS